MQLSDIKTMLAETDLPVTYYSWPEDDPNNPVPSLPYLVWYLPVTEHFAADDSAYARIETLNVELYTRTKDFATEAAVEAVLNAHHMIWSRSETFLDTENMYEVLYEMEILING